MNPSWQTWLTLALQVVVIVAPALLLTARVRSVIWQRTVWQSVVLLLAGLLLAEACAVGPWLKERLQSLPAPAPVQHTEPKADIAPAVITTPVIAEPIPASTPVFEEIAKPLPVEPPHIMAETPAPPVIVHTPFYPSFTWLLWWTGAGLFLLRLIAGRMSLLRFSQRLNQVMEVGLFDRVQALAVTLSLHRRVLVLESSRLVTPVVFGLWQPTIVVPERFATDFTPTQQEAILAHELAHLAARDPLWYCLADIVAALLWWHPLVWLARNRLQLASELAADEASLIHVRGPETLAECLVQLGQRLTRPRALESIGIEGQGFRSRLGQRVERLLQLRPSDSTAPRRWRTRAVRFGTLAVLLPLLLFVTGWVSPGADQRPWRSVGQEAWANFWTALKPPALLAAVIARPQTTVKPVAPAKPVAPPASNPAPEPAVLVVPPVVSGRVFLQGTPPPERAVNLPAEQAKLRGKPLTTHFYRVSPDNGLQDVFVYVKHGLEARLYQRPRQPALIETRGYEFNPTVVAMQTGQILHLTNSDSTGYNLHFSPNNRGNREWDYAMFAGSEISTVINAPEMFARLKTDIYPWMFAYVCAVDHPYFALTDAEGRFTFPQPLPPGRYTLAAVHRKTGEVLQEIIVSETNGSALSFTLQAPNVTAVQSNVPLKASPTDNALLARIASLMIKKVSADGLPLSSVLNSLKKESGIGFETETNVLGKNLGSVVVQLKPGLHWVTLEQALQAIVTATPVPMHYELTNGEIHFCNGPPKTEERSALVGQRWKAMSRKVDALHLAKVQFNRQPLSDVVRLLNQSLSSAEDAEANVNFVIRQHSNFPDGPYSLGMPLINLNAAVVSIGQPMENPTLRQALAMICQNSDPAIDYVVEDYGIVFTPRKPAGAWLYDAWRLSSAHRDIEAAARMEEVLVRDPHNEAAQSYLKQAQSGFTTTASNIAQTGTPGFPTSAALQNKLNSIVLPRVEFKNERLAEVVTYLARESKRFDPDHEGVVMLINSQAGTNQTALANLGDLPITLDRPLNHANLGQIFRFLVASTPREDYQGLDIEVEDHAVVFSWHSPKPPPLFTRMFRVDLNNFNRGLLNLPAAGNAVSSTNKTERIKEMLGKMGVAFTNGTQLFFNETTGVLMARASLDDLDTISMFIETTSTTAPQIVIDAQYVEVSEKVARQMGLQWFAEDLSPATNSLVWNDQFIKHRLPANEGVRIERPVVPNHVSVLSAGQFDALIRKLDSRKGIKFTHCPRVITLHARQTEVSLQEKMTLVTSMTNQLVKGTNGQPDQMVRLYGTTPLEIGPEFDLIPTVLPDGETLQLQWAFRITDFLGYDKPKSKADQPHSSLRLRQVSNLSTLRDGQTLLVGCGTAIDSADEKAGWWFHFSKQKEKYYTFAFLTVSIVDSAGNRAHSE